MTNTTVKQIVAQVTQELQAFYPLQEIEAMMFRILQHTSNLSRTDIYLKPETNVPKTELLKIEKIINALKKYEPLQYILGETSFYGLDFNVNPDVLIPRPETEELVDWILKENIDSSSKVIDLGSGSGCIGVSLAKFRPSWNVMAVDISPGAIQLAQKNARLNNVRVDFIEDSILDFSEKLLELKFDLIVSNPPYVTFDQKAEMQLNVLDYEPHLALFAPGKDPLVFYRKIASLSSTNLLKGGKVYVEINEVFPEKTEEIFKEHGFDTILKKDINGKFRMLKASRND